MMTMKICTNQVRRRTESVSISPSRIPFIGNKSHEIDTSCTITNIKYKTNNNLYK